ncbi:2-dehydro-3-deoxyphosphogluconate aldolase / (4S)-4-hydroxy-2-oxoglutarate aldolase [Prosthecobacter debontii]|uniref:2-dehydro-3-deoxy-phosphogluconate aldolase n=1 Tax=Prosthecobacter debontii TaxID=48467 RepID=A0A1T4WEE3_9BACT|nr:bifunctional 4-hydroxy-2-oxoglutarate aldolase/2-dehydro-3-deoxy-phosphogluconate aldolase [Prosthecobacter debontii]SKA75398.1 2-dehydro-3-deoxyphosphogluconate aldolase / (4S)-4-hydroxy-2-oxoglutarate aldolase [Prosthecobacter debontii]
MNETLELLSRHRAIPVVVLDELKKAIPLTDALVAGGLPLVEVTLRTPTSLSALERIIDRRDMIVGAGTVTTLAQFDAAWRLGVKFIVTPGLDESILRHGWRRDLLVIPGAVTPTEIMRAQNLGVNLVKFFPSHIFGGLNAIEALSAPFPKMRFLPTGGVNLDNLSRYLSNPSVLACGGTWMTQRDWIQEGAWDKVRSATAQSVDIARSFSDA